LAHLDHYILVYYIILLSNPFKQIPPNIFISMTTEYFKQYYKENKKAIQKYNLEYYYNNKEERDAYNKRYQKQNKERIAEKQRQYYIKNKKNNKTIKDI
jgi:hypothetical protein